MYYSIVELLRFVAGDLSLVYAKSLSPDKLYAKVPLAGELQFDCASVIFHMKSRSFVEGGILCPDN